MKSRHVLTLAIVALSLGFAPPERTTPERWALVVGISDYIHFGDEVGGDLPGAANDARAVADVLINRYGFDPSHVKLVLDTAATRRRIETEFTEWLPSVARPGDLVWFYFAGHGSQAWDLNADEEDGLDETVCPADVLRKSTANDILDDEIGEWLRGLPTENVVVVWDKCHARSSTRAVTPFARPRALNRSIRDVPKPSGAVARARTAEPTGPSATGARPPVGDALPPGILEIAASQADEVAIDAAFPSPDGGQPRFGGAFTTAFVDNLWKAPRGATYGDVFRETRQEMRRNRFTQDPGIDDTALKDRPLFWLPGSTGATAGTDAGADGVPIPATAAIRILALPSPSEAVLSGGFNADLTTGSLFGAGGALLEVTDVDPDRATARVVDRDTRGVGVARAGELAVGGEARLVAYRYPERILRVQADDLETDALARLRMELLGVPSLVLVGDSTAYADLLVRRRNGYWVVLSLDGFPRDSVAAPPGATGADPVVALAHLLGREFGQFQLARLENPAAPFPVDFAFGNGRNDFVLGEEVSFRVTSGRDGYLTIVDLAADGTVSVLFPNEYVTDNRVRAGETVVFPTPEMNLSFPAVEPTGPGIVRALVTERPLVLGFDRGDATEADRVWSALRAAVGRAPVEGSRALPVDGWATAAIVYRIRRP